MAWIDEKDRMTDTGLTVGQLFEATYPGQGQAVWEQQNAPRPQVPAPAPGVTTTPATSIVTTQGTPSVTNPTPGSHQEPVQAKVTTYGPSGGGEQNPSGGFSYPAPLPVQATTAAPLPTSPDNSAYADYLGQIASTNKSAVEWQQKFQQSQLDQAAAAQQWKQTYDQAMLQYNDRSLAQQAADSAVLAAYRAQTIALQQRQQQQSRRQLQPRRRARLRIL